MLGLQFAQFFGPRAAFVLITIPSELARGVVSRSVAALRASSCRVLGYVEHGLGGSVGRELHLALLDLLAVEPQRELGLGGRRSPLPEPNDDRHALAEGPTGCGGVGPGQGEQLAVASDQDCAAGTVEPEGLEDQVLLLG